MRHGGMLITTAHLYQRLSRSTFFNERGERIASQAKAERFASWIAIFQRVGSFGLPPPDQRLVIEKLGALRHIRARTVGCQKFARLTDAQATGQQPGSAVHRVLELSTRPWP
jgi:hypothetical protein